MTSPVTDALFTCCMVGFVCVAVGGFPLFALDDFKPRNRKLIRNTAIVLLVVGVVFFSIVIAWHLKNLFGAW